MMRIQIPNQRGLQPSLGLEANGITDFLSDDLNENQHELAEYAILSWQHSADNLNWQSSLSARFTSLHFSPDWTGDLLYNGLAQDAFKADTAIGWQTDASYTLNDRPYPAGGFLLPARCILEHDQYPDPVPGRRCHRYLSCEHTRQHASHGPGRRERSRRRSRASTCRMSGRS